MADDKSVFDKLVSQISSSERQALYQKLNASEEPDLGSFDAGDGVPLNQDYSVVDIKTQYKSEPVFVRFICALLALFHSRKKEEVYKDQLIERIGYAVAKKHPGLLDVRSGVLKGDCYASFDRLSESASFFRNAISRYAAERGDFYIVLSSVLIPRFYDTVSRIVDTFSIPFNRESPAEIRQSLVRSFDAAFSALDDVERSAMYNAVRSLEWLRRFSMMQYSRITARFAPDGRGGNQCRLDLISGELTECVDVLCNPRNISVSLLQALFLFNNQVRIEQQACDEEAEYHAFLASARECLANVRIFLSKIPVLEITRLAVRDCNYVPRAVDSGEDWFAAFKNAWKKKLDAQWAEWNRRYKKWQLQERICKFLQCETMPVLAYHPWLEVQNTLTFRQEMSFVFLRTFFSQLFAKTVNKPLKLIMMSGEFYKRENYIAYTEAYNMLDHLDEGFQTFEKRLSPRGNIGAVFHDVLKDKIITITGKHRIDSLMLTIDADSAALINESIAAINAMKDFLAMLLQRDGAAMRDVLSNLRVLENTSGKHLYADLQTAYETFRQALEIERDLESMEYGL